MAVCPVADYYQLVKLSELTAIPYPWAMMVEPCDASLTYPAVLRSKRATVLNQRYQDRTYQAVNAEVCSVQSTLLDQVLEGLFDFCI